MVDIARLGMDVDTGRVSAAVADLGKLTQAAAATEQGVKELEAGTRELSTVVQATGVRVRDASGRFVKAGEDIQAAGRKAREAGNDAQRGAAGFQGAGDAMQAVGAKARGASVDLRGIALQLNQVAQVAAMTGNPLQALAVQLPDIGIAFGTAGVVAGTFAAVLIPLAATLAKTRSGAVDAAEATDAFAASLDSYRSHAQTAAADTAELREQFGTFADEVQARAERMLRISAQAVVTQVAGVGTGLRQSVNEGLELLDAYEKRWEEYEEARRQQAAGVANSSQVENVRDLLNAAAQDLGAFTDRTGISVSKINELGAALRAMQDNTGQSMQVIRDEMNAALIVMQEMAESGQELGDEFYAALESLAEQVTNFDAALADTADAGMAQATRAMGELWESTKSFAADVLTGANNIGILDDSSLSGIWSGFDGLINRAASFLGLTNEIGASLNADRTGEFARVSGTPTGDYQRDLVSAVTQLADKLGMAAEDILAVLSYETGGTFDPAQPGPVTQHGQHIGLYQAGAPQRAQYGYDPTSGNAFEHVASLERYLYGSGFVPGMSREDLYSTINAGGPGRWSASDYSNGGDPNNKTVLDKVNEIFSGGHMGNAAELTALYGGQAQAGQFRTDALTNRLAGAIERGEAEYNATNPGAPPTRPMDLGVVPPVAPGGPQARPMDLAADHTAALTEMSEAARGLMAATDPLVDRELKIAEAQRQVNEAVAAGAITLPEGTKIMQEFTAGLDQEAANDIQQVEDKLNGLLGTMDETADAANKLAAAQETVNEAVAAGVISAAEGARIMQEFEGHLILGSDAVQDAMEAGEKALQDRKESFKSAFDEIGAAMANVLVYGQDWKEQFGNLLLSAAAQLGSSGFSSLLQTGFNSLFPSMGVGAGSSSVLSAIPGLPSFAGGGHTGYGSRTGGLDGQGGFMSMLHPQEVVQDLTRESARDNRGIMEINVVGATGNEEIKAMVGQGIQAAFAQHNQALPDKVQHIQTHWRDR